MKRLMIAFAATAALAMPASSMFAMVPADRVDEVPVERLLENISRNAQNLPEGEKWRAIGRLQAEGLQLQRQPQQLLPPKSLKPFL